MKALIAPLALSLALAAGTASAAPVSGSPFFSGPIQSLDGSTPFVFDDTYHFALGEASIVSGSITTFSSVAGFDPYVDITSAFLTRVGFAGQVDLVEVYDAVGIDGLGVETWTLSGQQLAAGDWELHVAGYDINDKRVEGYVARLDAAPVGNLPEPGSMALMGLAVAGLGASRRRKR